MKPGLFINPARRFSFNFDGREISAFEGDTVATALWRCGVKTLSRSFKYHRRRGILSLSGADANTLMDIDGAPNARADQTPAAAGMLARSRHCVGSAENDRLAAMNWLSPFLPPGFYYKAFFRPRGAWPLWEPLIRRLAGIGQVNPVARPDAVEKVHAFCDVAIIGGGPAGLAAARAAARAGDSVCLLDKNPQFGGSLNWRGGGRENIAAVESEKNIRLYPLHEATGIFADNLIAANGPQHSLRLRAKKIICATGARDTPAVFANNDLPGIMLISAALRLAFLYDLACGRRAVILATNAADANAARLLKNYGASVAAVFNLGEKNSAWAESLSSDGFTVFDGVREFSASGRQFVSGVRAVCGGRRKEIACDCVLMNGGSLPAAELSSGAGAAAKFVLLAGGVNNRPAAAEKDGEAAAEGGARPPQTGSPANNVFLSGGGGKAFVDFDEDLVLKDLDVAIGEGFDDVQLLKRYTTAGMGPSQGKLTNMLAARRLAKNRGDSLEDVGQTTVRPPAAAETLAGLANPPRPLKRAALDRMHVNLAASFMNAGVWRRPAHYTGAEKESLAVREKAGIIDISTLGKIMLSGPDAAKLLEHVYAGKFAAQKPGAVRYALMLDESGIIADDGVAARLDEDRFFLTATTGNAEAVYRMLLLWKARLRLRVDLANLTSAYAAVNLAGPDAPRLLAKFSEAGAELGYMRAAEIKIGGAPAFAVRTGFVGEKGFEIHLPSGYASDLWNALLADAAPFGVEAQRLLRLEKGHIIIGQDTDGLTTPEEADMEWALGRDKPFYLGKRALEIHKKRGIRRQLRGFILPAHNRRTGESDLVLAKDGGISGHITSAAYSPTLGRVIGLAFAPPQTRKTGGVLLLRAAGGEVMEARTFAPPFYDKEGGRQK